MHAMLCWEQTVGITVLPFSRPGSDVIPGQDRLRESEVQKQNCWTVIKATNAGVAVILTATLLMAGLVVATRTSKAAAPTVEQAAVAGLGPIHARNLDVSRAQANRQPRRESEQAVVNGWPLYRTPRGQAAFNAAMATLQATETIAPNPAAFKNCKALACPLILPKISADGWLQAGRIWLSPQDYVVIAHSPRLQAGERYRRRSARAMRFFILHEFHNSSNNTDPFDTISSHARSVYVPLYMSKQQMDAMGRRFVLVVQVAPYDVFSVHAMNKGSAGPGIEVAKNPSDLLEPLQAQAGIVIASMITAAAPRLAVVNHRGTEGLPMLQAYQQRLAQLRAKPPAKPFTLPFVPALAKDIATATADLADLILRPGAKPRRQLAKRPAPANRTVVASQLLYGPIEVFRLVEPVRPANRPATRPDCTTSSAGSPVAKCRTLSQPP
jgi:hypothetical protein